MSINLNTLHILQITATAHNLFLVYTVSLCMCLCLFVEGWVKTTVTTAIVKTVFDNRALNFH